MISLKEKTTISERYQDIYLDRYAHIVRSMKNRVRTIHITPSNRACVYINGTWWFIASGIGSRSYLVEPVVIVANKTGP